MFILTNSTPFLPTWAREEDLNERADISEAFLVPSLSNTGCTPVGEGFRAAFLLRPRHLIIPLSLSMTTIGDLLPMTERLTVWTWQVKLMDPLHFCFPNKIIFMMRAIHTV